MIKKKTPKSSTKNKKNDNNNNKRPPPPKKRNSTFFGKYRNWKAQQENKKNDKWQKQIITLTLEKFPDLTEEDIKPIVMKYTTEKKSFKKIQSKKCLMR